jgi:hypothetical protein
MTREANGQLRTESERPVVVAIELNALNRKVCPSRELSGHELMHERFVDVHVHE